MSRFGSCYRRRLADWFLGRFGFLTLRVTRSIAADGEHLIYEGARGEELGCRVIAFDAPEKAQAMQAWIDTSRIADRPRPEPPPDYPQLKVG